MKKSFLLFIALCVCTIHADTKLNYHDPLPITSINYPFDFLNSDYKAELARDLTKNISERVKLSGMTFIQTADYGYNKTGTRVPAGEINGRIGLLPMTYGSTPTGQTANSLLTLAGDLPYSNITSHLGGTTPHFNNDNITDLQQNFGFLGVSTEYRKIGSRFQLDMRIFNNFVISAQGGVCDLRQSVTGYTNMSTYTTQASLGADSSDDLDDDKANIHNNLMRLYKEIFYALGINYDSWHSLGIEDAQVSLTWRGNIPVEQESESTSWTRFVIIPHATVTVTGAFGNPKNPDIILSLPFGNNGHHAVTLSTGVAFAFNDTIEVFTEGGLTQFTERCYTERVPTSIYQSRLYQYKTDIKVKPANTVHASVGLNAHYFVDRLSGYVQMHYASHEQDEISLVKHDSAYKPARLAQDTEWKMAVLNIGLNYDLSPNVSFGGAIQAPIHQRATYSSNTLSLGIACTF